MIQQNLESIYNNIKSVLDEARNNAFRSVNFAMVQAYWHIGRLIVEEEQNGKERADYGESLIQELSKRLTIDYGKGFNKTNLVNAIAMRIFGLSILLIILFSFWLV